MLKFIKSLWPFVHKRELNIVRHQRDKAEALLMECYAKVPQLHYDNCSDYAKFMLFKRNDNGIIVYKDPKVQTVEPPK